MMDRFFGFMVACGILYLLYRLSEYEKQQKELEKQILFLFEDKFNKKIDLKPDPAADVKQPDKSL